MIAPASETNRETPTPWRPSTWATLLAALTVLTFIVAGYHPYAEDGGMYFARVLALLHPHMFTSDAAFVREPLRISLFAPLIVALHRILHLPLAWILFALDIASIALLLIAGRAVLRRCIAGEPAQLAGTALLGAWATMPVAATSLMLTDPYVTARTFSTPLTLLALAFALDDPPAASTSWHRRPRLRCAACLLAAFLFHPLMAAYAAVLVALIEFARLRRSLSSWIILTLLAIAIAGAIQALAPAVSPASRIADHSRYYWFLAQWHWYEIAGLIAPLALLAALSAAPVLAFTDRARRLCRATIVFGLLGPLIALLFAHESYRSHLIARLQPLRVDCLVYALMPLLLGAALQQFCTTVAQRGRIHASPLLRTLLRSTPALIIAASACAMFAVQRQTFPASGQLELPWSTTPNPNPWVRAFLWIRTNTPPTAVFALEARYVTLHGEDAQIFRAIAQRSALPDFSKDGGEASQMPQLAPIWLAASTAQQNLSTQTDALRDARLQPLGATWMVLLASANTTHPCPYANAVVKVCTLTR